MSETAKLNRFKFDASALRAYTMIGALVVIWLFFHYATAASGAAGQSWGAGEYIQYFFSFAWLGEGIFLMPRNLSNLMLQTAVTGVLAVGMLMVIVAGQIDLSVGSALGLAGAVAAICLTSLSLGLIPAILVAVAIGVAIGLIHGTLVAYANIPAFIVTLGGLLAWRGAVKGISRSETIPIADQSFRAIGQSYVAPAIGWTIAAIAVAAVLFSAYRKIQSNKIYASENVNPTGTILSALAQAALIVGFVFVMNSNTSNPGVPTPVLIFLAIALLGVFITNFTVFGRYLYAIGGNADAARLSGINNKFKIVQVYAFLGALTGIAALIFTARVGSATPDAGTLEELDAIAACVIGGASLVGGRGTIFGACVGALIMASLDNGMSLLNVSDFLQDIIKGAILVAAVGLDMIGRKQS